MEFIIFPIIALFLLFQINGFKLEGIFSRKNVIFFLISVSIVLPVVIYTEGGDWYVRLLTIVIVILIVRIVDSFFFQNCDKE